MAKSPGILALAAIGLCLQPANADSFRCGSQLVTEGDYIASVRRACGEPDQLERRYLERLVRSPYRVYGQRGPQRLIGIWQETWTYELGSQRFDRILTFENDRLVRIDEPVGSR